MKKKKKEDISVYMCICMRYDILMQKQIQIGLPRRKM